MTRLLIAALAAVTLAACSEASNPAAPSSSSAENPAVQGATINGTVAGASSSALFSTSHGAGASAGVTVMVEGTDIRTTTNGLGQFALANVPAGRPVVLHFTGAGANAKLPLGTIAAGETVTLAVAVDGDEVLVQEKTQGNDKEIEGLIESIEGNALTVRARNVMVTSSTKIRHGETAMTVDELLVGQRVHVKGTVEGAGETAVTTATEILVQNLKTDAPVNLQGTVSSLSGDAGAFEFVVQGRTVKGDAATAFKGGKSPSFAGLTNGRKVHVKGAQQNGYVQAQSVTLQGK